MVFVSIAAPFRLVSQCLTPLPPGLSLIHSIPRRAKRGKTQNKSPAILLSALGAILSFDWLGRGQAGCVNSEGDEFRTGLGDCHLISSHTAAKEILAVSKGSCTHLCFLSPPCPNILCLLFNHILCLHSSQLPSHRPDPMTGVGLKQVSRIGLGTPSLEMGSGVL